MLRPFNEVSMGPGVGEAVEVGIDQPLVARVVKERRHGGILDRFDSLLFSSAMIYIHLLIFIV